MYISFYGVSIRRTEQWKHFQLVLYSGFQSAGLSAVLAANPNLSGTDLLERVSVFSYREIQQICGFTCRESHCTLYEPSRLPWRPLWGWVQRVSWGLLCSIWVHLFAPTAQIGGDTWTRPPILLASCKARNSLCLSASVINSHKLIQWFS